PRTGGVSNTRSVRCRNRKRGKHSLLGSYVMIDLICKMEVDERSAAGKYVFEGKTYLFCSLHCLETFKKEPAKYVAPASHGHEESVKKSSPEAVYTCPMDPDVLQSKPGPCPKCGMALEPRTVTLDEEVNPELVDMTRRFWVSVLLTAPIFFFAMSDLIPGQPIQRLLPMRLLNWIQLLLATPVVLWGGWPFFERGWASITNRSPNMFTLISLGVGAAYIYSVVA